jgi:hypothetical protein
MNGATIRSCRWKSAAAGSPVNRRTDQGKGIVLQRIRRMLRRLSVRNRLILSIFSASLIVVLVVGVMLVSLSTRTIRQQAEEGLTTTTAVLSQDFVKNPVARFAGSRRGHGVQAAGVCRCAGSLSL